MAQATSLSVENLSRRLEEISKQTLGPDAGHVWACLFQGRLGITYALGAGDRVWLAQFSDRRYSIPIADVARNDERVLRLRELPGTLPHIQETLLPVLVRVLKKEFGFSVIRGDVY